MPRHCVNGRRRSDLIQLFYDRLDREANLFFGVHRSDEEPQAGSALLNRRVENRLDVDPFVEKGTRQPQRVERIAENHRNDRRVITVADVETGGYQTVLSITADRCSNGPHIYYPNPHGPGGTGEKEDWVCLQGTRPET